MTQFQKIAIGLLGLTNPEMFIPRPKPGVPSRTDIEAADDGVLPERLRQPDRRAARAMRALKSMAAALGMG